MTEMDAVENGHGSYEGVCETFLKQSKEFSIDYLNSIEAYVISEDNPVDACYEFIKYLKSQVVDI